MGGSKTAAYRQAHCAPGRVLCAPGRFPLSRLRSSCKVHSVRWGRRTAAHLSSVPRIGCVILAGARHRPHPFPVALPASPCSRPAAAPCTQSFKSVGERLALGGSRLLKIRVNTSVGRKFKIKVCFGSFLGHFRPSTSRPKL
jgi:hypothetical protein